MNYGLVFHILVLLVFGFCNVVGNLLKCHEAGVGEESAAGVGGGACSKVLQMCVIYIVYNCCYAKMIIIIIIIPSTI